jgi:hypothetical protein
MIDPSASPDPRAPTRKLSHEVILWVGFGLCLVIAVVTVVLPELSGVEPGGGARAAQKGAATGKAAPTSASAGAPSAP